LKLYAWGEPAGEPQDESRVTVAKKLRKEDGRIDISRPAAEVANHINGMWSWPGASCRFISAGGHRDERVILARARQVAVPPEPLPPGTIDARLYVTTGDGCLELLEIKPESGKLMTWQEFVNGRHVQPGDRFEVNS
jgi:methionyl-tRNA formyltransferase